MRKGLTGMLAIACIAIVAEAAFAPTPWGERVTSENCLRDYPRPQMVRNDWTCLNGDWDYAITAVTNTPGRPAKWDGKIRVPFALEAPLSMCGGRLLNPDEYLWYTRDVELDPRPGERILLHFGAVDFRAIVYLGHDEVAIHEGGHLPFTVDLTPFARKGVNALTILVWDPTEDYVQSCGKQAFKSSTCFYTRVSGMWQTVWIETVPEKHIADYKVDTDIDKGEVTLTFNVDGLVYGDREEGAVEIYPMSLRGTFRPGEPVTFRLPSPVSLWSPESPALYHFTARFGKDDIKGYFGMRKFEKRRDAKGVLRFFLNNKPYYVMGTLDQGWWPDGLLTPPSEEAMEFDIQTLKKCGFNAMRKHIKVEPLRYYALCDRIGLLVLQDMPSRGADCIAPFHADSVKGYGLYREEVKGIMDLLMKVPSVVMWIPYNEGWGQHGQNLTHTTLDFIKRYDPSRLVDGPSGWNDFEGGECLDPADAPKKLTRLTTVHIPDGLCEAADVVDYHYYPGPAMPPVNSRRVSFLGEFGGLVTSKDIEKTYLGLMDKLGDLAEKGLGGSIYTQSTDVEFESNGLLTYDRKVLKYHPETLKTAHAAIIRRAVGE